MFLDFLSLIYPDCCLTCEAALVKQEELLCTACLHQLPRTYYHKDQENALAQRFWGKVQLRWAMAYLKYTKSGKVQKLLHALKYQGEQAISYRMGKLYGQELLASGFAQSFDLILPVPLHKKKLKKRRYNQVDGFAKALAECMACAWISNGLVRTQYNTSQTNKGRMNRWKNVQGLFQVGDKADVQGKRVLVVDDVVTTGATLEACVEAVLALQPASVSVAAIASAEF
ncbi:phosphoribosyltransferase family protein [Rapidithrix thailandica]|uniref:Phosphoribosyltransferase family protein n=1 Tax=Rapidithrix thailandica TaxID=413964 RepID=A0AAW9S7J7_9BACT